MLHLILYLSICITCCLTAQESVVDVVVIGSGLSGLTTAYELSKVTPKSKLLLQSNLIRLTEESICIDSGIERSHWRSNTKS